MKLGRNVNILTARYILCMACIFSSACAVARGSNCSIHDFFGEYVLTGVEKYRGGITSEKQAKDKINEKVLICPQKFLDANNNIEPPRYRLENVNVEFEEGVVLSKKHSTHYGFMTDRKRIQYLYLLSPNGSNEVFQKYEKIGKDKIMKSFDGYFYFFKKVRSCEY